MRTILLQATAAAWLLLTPAGLLATPQNATFCEGFEKPEDPSDPDSAPGAGPFDRGEADEGDIYEWPYVGDVVQYMVDDYKESQSEAGAHGVALGQGFGVDNMCFRNSPRG
jgi:hypothetical protein